MTRQAAVPDAGAEREPDQDAQPQEDDQAEAPPAGPQNIVEVQDAGTLLKKVTVTILRERIDGKFDEMFGELRQTAQIPGFRIGRAPRRLIEKRFGKEVRQDVRNALIGESISDAIEKSELNTLGEPKIDLEKIELPESDDMQFSFEVEVMPEFDLPKLEGIRVQKPIFQATAERIGEAVERYRLEQVGYEPTNEAAAEGDAVTAGARITGEGIEPVVRPALTLRVAPGQIEGLPLVDLGKALAGRKAGETVALTVKVADAHPNEDWHGKELNLRISISQVSRRILPTDDQLASRFGFESVKEFRDEVRQYVEARADMDAQRAMRDQLRKYLLENTRFDLPRGVLKMYATRALRRRYVQLLNMGIAKEQIDEHMTRLQADVVQQSQRDLKVLLIMNKIAQEKEVTVSPEEVNAGVAQMAQMYGRRPERLRHELDREGAMSAVEDSIRDDKILDMLLADADVTELAPDGRPKPQEPPRDAKEDQ